MISTEKAFDMLPSVENIYEKLDIDNFRKELKDRKEKENLDSNDLGIELAKFVLKNSAKVKEEFFELAAIFEGKAIEEVKNQSLSITINTVKAIFSDKDTTDFFKSAIQ